MRKYYVLFYGKDLEMNLKRGNIIAIKRRHVNKLLIVYHYHIYLKQKEKNFYLFELQLGCSLLCSSFCSPAQIYPMHATHDIVPSKKDKQF
jgi:hypothetical protein